MIKDSMDFLPNLSQRSESKILRVVFNTDFRNGHDGLAQIAKNHKINVTTLNPGEYVVFVNTQRTAVKLFAAGQCIAHFRMPSHRKMDMRIIGLIPKFFNGREIKYDDALKELITKEWALKK